MSRACLPLQDGQSPMKWLEGMGSLSHIWFENGMRIALKPFDLI